LIKGFYRNKVRMGPIESMFSSLLLKIITLGTYFIRLFPPEISHSLALNSLKVSTNLGVSLKLKDSKNLPEAKKLLGMNFKNQLGISAGLDKNGDYIECLSKLGIGFLEVGTVTPRPQKGNPKPRLFRDTKNLSLTNSMGFNNKGVNYLVSKARKKTEESILAISVGKNFDTPLDEAIKDYSFCLKQVFEVADMITVNISSPNTQGLRELQSSQKLPQLLGELKREQLELSKIYGYKPLLVKISPDENEKSLEKIAKDLIAHEIDGLIATNTSEFDGEKRIRGGISGSKLLQKSNRVLSTMRTYLGEDFPIIASGGVTDLKTYKQKIEAGADLVQIYTGLVYKGPKLIHEIVNEQENN